MKARALVLIPEPTKTELKYKVMPLVQCRDCKWNSGTTEKPFCMMRSVPSPKDWFCADGERSE